MCSRLLFASAFALMLAPLAAQSSKKFLGEGSPFLGSAFDKINNTVFKNDIMAALGPMFGCGGEVSADKAAAIHRTLEPMWKAIPKLSADRIDRRSLRHLAHRYFMKASNLVVRGFEPARLTNESHWGAANILSQMVPAYVESVLESEHGTSRGFSLTDAVHMIMMLDQLILDSENFLLHKVYTNQHRPLHNALSEKGMTQVMEDYLVEWIVEGSDEDMALLISNRTLIAELIPHWDLLAQLASGSVKSLQYARLQHILPSTVSHTWNARFSLEDATTIAAGITQNFHSFWRSECISMKDGMLAMDTHHTGRVPLSKLYQRGIDADWRFGESEDYLREMGVLDESSSSLGPQVIIPNYMQAVSNCIISTPHYLVCCANDCEAILGEIEAAVQTPTPSAKRILDVVANITVQTNVDDDYKPDLTGKLTQLLEDIETSSGGLIPLHGRLFAQWLHYAFPQECAFPHKAGITSLVTPSEYGESYIADEADMQKHAATANTTEIPITVEKEQLNWMSQWSHDEELLVDYSKELGASWRMRGMGFAFASLSLFVAGIAKGMVSDERKPSELASGHVCYV